MEEIWKDIEGYEGLYQISSNGKVFSLRNKSILKERFNKGYVFYILSNSGVKKNMAAHRLVAQAFIPNPENKPQVNHLDENPGNNRVNNLDWVTAKENNDWGTRTARTSATQKMTMTTRKPVIIIYPSGKIRECVSQKEASIISGKPMSVIAKIASGRQKLGRTRDGYRFKYYSLEHKSE